MCNDFLTGLLASTGRFIIMIKFRGRLCNISRSRTVLYLVPVQWTKVFLWRCCVQVSSWHL